METGKGKSNYRRRPFPKGEGNNMRRIISDLERKLDGSIRPERIVGLNSFERKLVHRHFDHKRDFQTRTYRDGDEFTLFVYPVGNIERFAIEKAQECLATGADIELPSMGSYERFIVHNALKDITGVESLSHGEGPDRKVQIVSRKFGRGLKKIAKKIKLF